jgi:hypothetical protein
VKTPAGDAWILADDEAALRQPFSSKAAAAARLMPSGDAYYLVFRVGHQDLSIRVPHEFGPVRY